MQSFEMKELRMITGLTRMVRVRNDDIREELGMESILIFIYRDSCDGSD